MEPHARGAELAQRGYPGREEVPGGEEDMKDRKEGTQQEERGRRLGLPRAKERTWWQPEGTSGG